jgi:hypothetical protein
MVERMVKHFSMFIRVLHDCSIDDILTPPPASDKLIDLIEYAKQLGISPVEFRAASELYFKK